MTAQTREEQRRADALIFTAMLLFGGYSLFLRFFPQLSAFDFLLAFQMVGMLFFVFMAKGRVFWTQGEENRRIKLSDFGLFAALAVVALANDLLYFTAFRLTTIANAAVAHQTVSIFLIILAPFMLGERTKRKEYVALALAFAGTIVLYQGGNKAGGHNPQPLMGITLGVLSGLFYALLVILYRKLHGRDIAVRVTNYWRFLLSTLALSPLYALVPEIGKEKLDGGDALALLAFGVLFAGIASGIHNYAMSRARALHSSIIGKTEPIAAALYAALVFGEIPNIWVVAGGALIIGSSVWLAFDAREEAPEEADVDSQFANEEVRS